MLCQNGNFPNQDSVKTISADSFENSSPTTASDSVNQFKDDDDFSPGLALFAVSGLIFISICVGVGIVLTLVVLLVLFGLMSVGIISTSVLIGLKKKSFASGFKTFILSVTASGGLIAGIAGFWLLHKITHWWTTQNSLIAGSATGLIAGILSGLLIFFVFRKVLARLLLTKIKNRITRKK